MIGGVSKGAAAAGIDLSALTELLGDDSKYAARLKELQVAEDRTRAAQAQVNNDRIRLDKDRKALETDREVLEADKRSWADDKKVEEGRLTDWGTSLEARQADLNGKIADERAAAERARTDGRNLVATVEHRHKEASGLMRRAEEKIAEADALKSQAEASANAMRTARQEIQRIVSALP